jgi:L-ascorbate metabolism protein UlaG (beta-lactamase superfamily)
MKIQWFGQSCFLFISKEGKKVLTDPFNSIMGYKLPDVQADIVTTSHNHGDHNNVAIVKGNYVHLNTCNKFVDGNIEVIGIPTFHDASSGKYRGQNIIFKYIIDNISICHCGDLGHILTSEQLLKIGHVDILLIPVGGLVTINHSKAYEVVKQINPTIIIPMHYRTKALGIKGFLFSNVEKFTSIAGKRIFEIRDLTIEKQDLSKYSGIVILKYD